MTKGIFIGGVPVKNIQIGATPIKQVYLGSTKIWPAWSPLDIADNALSAYYEFGVGLTSKGFHRCYQDVARTNPCTTVGQIIKSVSDLSGNGRHLSSNNSPTLQQDASGYYLKREAGQTGNAFATTSLDDNVANYCNLAIYTGSGGDGPIGTVTQIATYNKFPTGILLQFNSTSSSNVGINGQGVGPSGVPNLSFDASTITGQKTSLYYRAIYQAPNTNFYCYRNGNNTIVPGSNNGFVGQTSVKNSNFAIGHNSHKLRAVLYKSNKAISDADWALLDAYWKNEFTGAQPI